MPLKKILEQLNNFLRKLKEKKTIDSYALIGGLAISARSKPRATKDVDFLISTAFEEKFFKEVASLPDFRAELKKGDFGDPIHLLIRLYGKDQTAIADFIVSHLNWQQEIINGATEIKLEEEKIPVPLAEDLAILKLKAGSPQDLLDAEELLKATAQKPEGINFQRLNALAERAQVDKNLAALLEKLKFTSL